MKRDPKIPIPAGTCPLRTGINVPFRTNPSRSSFCDVLNLRVAIRFIPLSSIEDVAINAVVFVLGGVGARSYFV